MVIPPSREMSIPASREAVFFIGTNSNPHGVVVETHWDRHDHMTQTVVDFTEHRSVYVLRSAYRVRECPKTRSQYYKDERPYEIFENVNYRTETNNPNIVDLVVARNQKKFECFNMGNDIIALQTCCVFSEDGRCFADVVGEIPCPKEIRDDILSENVTFECFVHVHFTKAAEADPMAGRQYPVSYSLFKVDRIDPERFNFALQAPWAVPIKRDFFVSDDPFEGDYIEEPAKVDNVPEVRGYYLSGKELYLPSRPRWSVTVAYNRVSGLVGGKKIPLVPYSHLMVDLRLNPVVNRYIAYEVVQRVDLSLNAEQVGSSNSPLHRLKVSPLPRCPGFFVFERNQGLAFDKYGLLSRLYDVGDFNGTVRADLVYVTPGIRNYTPLVIYDTPDDNQRNIEKEEFSVLCIGPREFYCAEIHHVSLWATEKIKAFYLPGHWYKIKWDFIDFDNFRATVYPILDLERKPLPVKQKSDIDFEIWTSIEFIKTPFPILRSREYGAIGITQEQLDKKENEFRVHRVASIAFAPAPKDTNERVQCRPFLVNTFKTDAPHSYGFHVLDVDSSLKERYIYVQKSFN